MHLYRTFSKLLRHDADESLNTEKSSINTSMHFSIISKKMAFTHLWNVDGALQSPRAFSDRQRLQIGK